MDILPARRACLCCIQSDRFIIRLLTYSCPQGMRGEASQAMDCQARRAGNWSTDILACELTGPPPLVAGLPPVTLQDRLTRHDVPPWLHEIAHADGYHLYRIESHTGN